MSALARNLWRRKTELVTLGLCAGLLLIVTACVNLFLSENKYISPHDFIGSEWQSDDPVLFLQVLDNREIKGYILLNSEKADIQCSIEYGRDIRIYLETERDTLNDSDCVLEGSCVCTEQKVVITVKKDYRLGGRYDKIILKRIDTAAGSENA